MHLSRGFAILGAATAVTAHPFEDLIERAVAPYCSTFSKTCYNTALRHQVRGYCTETLYPYTTTTVTHGASTVSYTTTTVTPAASTKYVAAKQKATVTSTSTATSITVTTTTTTSTTYVPPGTCTGSGPSPAAPEAHDVHRLYASPKCISSYTASSQYSSACSCLGITKIETSTVTNSAGTSTITSTKTATAKVSVTTITTTATVTVPTATTTTSTSTSVDVVATQTVNGFAVAYNGYYGTFNNDAIQFTYAASSQEPVYALQIDFEDDNFLYVVNPVIQGSSGYQNGMSGSVISFGNGASEVADPLNCQVSDSCILQCNSGDLNTNYIYTDASNPEQNGLWFLNFPSGTGPFQTQQSQGQHFDGPMIVQYPSGASM